MTGLSRRRMIALALRGAGLGWAGAHFFPVLASDTGHGAGPAWLPEFVETLFPHPGLPREVYADAAADIRKRAGSSGAVPAAALDAGMARLDALCGAGGWAGAKHAARVAAMHRLEQADFFKFVRNAAVEILYRDPRVWRHIGYGGNALARGGYLTHGFNDIDWLPEH